MVGSSRRCANAGYAVNEVSAKDVSPPRRIPQRYSKGQERREQIVEAVIALISRDGIQAVTHRAVALEAGVGPSAPSYFFPSIDDLVVEAFRAIMRRMVADLNQLAAEVGKRHLDGPAAVDAHVDLVSRGSVTNDRLQYEAYVFASRWPSLGNAVRESDAASDAVTKAILTAADRADLVWAIPIMRALSDGFGLQRVTGESISGFEGLREGLLALITALPPRGD